MYMYVYMETWICRILISRCLILLHVILRFCASALLSKSGFTILVSTHLLKEQSELPKQLSKFTLQLGTQLTFNTQLTRVYEFFCKKNPTKS